MLASLIASCNFWLYWSVFLIYTFWHVAASVVCVLGCFRCTRLLSSCRPRLCSKHQQQQETNDLKVQMKTSPTYCTFTYSIFALTRTQTGDRQTDTDRPTRTPHHTHTHIAPTSYSIAHCLYMHPILLYSPYITPI